jgi:hypothetical protein
MNGGLNRSMDRIPQTLWFAAPWTWKMNTVHLILVHLTLKVEVKIRIPAQWSRSRTLALRVLS